MGVELLGPSGIGRLADGGQAVAVEIHFGQPPADTVDRFAAVAQYFFGGHHNGAFNDSGAVVMLARLLIRGMEQHPRSQQMLS